MLKCSGRCCAGPGVGATSIPRRIIRLRSSGWHPRSINNFSRAHIFCWASSSSMPPPIPSANSLLINRIWRSGSPGASLCRECSNLAFCCNVGSIPSGSGSPTLASARACFSIRSKNFSKDSLLGWYAAVALSFNLPGVPGSRSVHEPDPGLSAPVAGPPLPGLFSVTRRGVTGPRSG